MKLSYPVALAIATIVLMVVAVAAFGRISADALDGGSRGAAFVDSVQTPQSFARATDADYAAFARADSAWRAEHARAYTLAELRARGDGRRSAREVMQDRVFRYRQQGQTGQAIAELERWVARNPRDQAALQSLARLLNEAGRTDAAVQRYRQLIAIQEGRR